MIEEVYCKSETVAHTWSRAGKIEEQAGTELASLDIPYDFERNAMLVTEYLRRLRSTLECEIASDGGGVRRAMATALENYLGGLQRNCRQLLPRRLALSGLQKRLAGQFPAAMQDIREALRRSAGDSKIEALLRSTEWPAKSECDDALREYFVRIEAPINLRFEGHPVRFQFHRDQLLVVELERQELFLFDASGELLDRIDTSHLEAPYICASNGKVFALKSNGNHVTLGRVCRDRLEWYGDIKTKLTGDALSWDGTGWLGVECVSGDILRYDEDFEYFERLSRWPFADTPPLRSIISVGDALWSLSSVSLSEVLIFNPSTVGHDDQAQRFHPQVEGLATVRVNSLVHDGHGSVFLLGTEDGLLTKLSSTGDLIWMRNLVNNETCWFNDLQVRDERVYALNTLRKQIEVVLVEPPAGSRIDKSQT